MQLDNFTRQYIITALWSTTNEDGDSLDNLYDISDFADETLEKIVKDCNDFRSKNLKLIVQALNDQDESTIAHDFWLTRNGHGSGFWDGDYNKSVGEALTNAAHSFGEVDLYVGDDGKIYCN